MASASAAAALAAKELAEAKKKKGKESPKYTSAYAHRELKDNSTGKVVKSDTVKLKPSSVNEALGGGKGKK